jgi:hypothetical protein
LRKFHVDFPFFIAPLTFSFAGYESLAKAAGVASAGSSASSHDHVPSVWGSPVAEAKLFIFGVMGYSGSGYGED